MTTYSTQTLSGITAAQFDGTTASFDLVRAICADARMDPTHERQVRVPAGGSHGLVRTMHKNDWIVSVVAGEFIVIPNATFAFIFQ